MNNKKIKLLIIDDHLMMLEGWRAILDKEEDLEIVNQLMHPRDLIPYLHANKVDIIITDMEMHEERMAGMETLRLVKTKYSEIKVLVVSMHEEIGFIQGAIEADTDGYILKNDSSDEMLLAIRKIYNGETYFSQKVISKITKRMQRAGKTGQIKLTPREKIILNHLCTGLSSKEVSIELDISVNTVNTYRKQLFSKFNVNKISEFLIKARELGFY